MVDQYNLLKQDLISHDVEIGMLKDDVAAKSLALEQWERRSREAEDKAALEAESLAAWYHDPVFMGLIGFAGGVAATTAVVVVLSHHP